MVSWRRVNIYISGRGGFAVQVAEALEEAGHVILGAASPGLRKRRSDSTAPMSWDRLRSGSFPRDIPRTEALELRAHHIPVQVDVIVAGRARGYIGRRTRARPRGAAIGYHPRLLP